MVDIKVQKSVFIDLPIEEVFAYMSDLENMADWSSAIIAVRKVSPGAVCAGTLIRGTIRFLGRWLNVIFEIVEYQPNCYLALKSISGSAPCLFCYQFEPAEGGGTTASEEAVIQMVGASCDHEHPVVVNAIHRQVEYDLLTLKDILEAKVALY